MLRKIMVFGCKTGDLTRDCRNVCKKLYDVYVTLI